MRVLWMVMLGGCLGGPTWMAHPCGNGDPVSFECDDAEDEVLAEPSEPLCDELGVADGDACEDPDARCVIEQGFTCASKPDQPASSEAYLHCRRKEWTEEDALCPQSSRAVKRDIRYVQGDERRQLADEILAVKLARYEYRNPAKSGQKLGYILEDSPQATFSGDGRVDLYAYLSALVATTQEQQAQIEQLRAEIRALKAAPRASVPGPEDSRCEPLPAP